MYSDVMIIKIEFLPDLIEAVVLPCSSIGRLVLSVCDSTSGRPPHAALPFWQASNLRSERMGMV
jgi:hypothetical protein